MVRYAKGYAGQQDWIGFHDDLFPQDTDDGKDWSARCGYESQIAEVKARQPVPVFLKGKNLGFAPFYYPCSVEWGLLDASGKVVELCKTEWDIRK